MAELQVSKTPSPPPRVHTPQTPRLGAFGDHWEPYSPRKSARIANRTPSPQTSSSSAAALRNTTASRKSTFSTPATSPQKRRAPAMDSVIRAPRAAAPTADGTAHSTASLADGSGSIKSHLKTATAALPTPAKTPRKQPDEKIQAGVRAVARNLFAGEPSTTEATASPRKRKTKTYTGVSLESFRAEEVEEEFPIFTDSRDRLPEIDDSADNPFFGDNVEAQPSTRRSTRVKKVLVPGFGKIPVDQAVQRDDGIVYVFRGKSFWKPREVGGSGDIENHAEADGEDLATPAAQRSGSPPRRTTRSSIKPRLLFPKQEQQSLHHDTDEEEAATDIEDHAAMTNEPPHIETPAEERIPDTPTAPRFAPASPPTTARATRVSKRLVAEDTPAKRAGRKSPFDSWRRSKTGAAAHGQKREAESHLPNEGPSKRQRA